MTLYLAVQSGVPASRSWDVTNADDTARDLTGLAPFLLINDAADVAPLIAEITGTVSGSTVLFSIPAIPVANTAKTFPCYLKLKAIAGGALADDGQWKGVCTVDGGGALASAEELKVFLSITHSEDDLALYQAAVAGSRWFENQIGRTVRAADYVELQDGTGGRLIVPSNPPLISVATNGVTVNGTTFPLSTGYGVAGYYLNGSVIRLRDLFVSQGYGNVAIQYRGGYESVPDDIRQAVLEVSAIMYRERDRIGIQSKTLGGEPVSFYYAPPARVVSTVEAYRRTM